tara:strand:+ start:1541 stop:1825 length:285 start_codon:yes stop_codon:yes gene_type:complete
LLALAKLDNGDHFMSDRQKAPEPKRNFGYNLKINREHLQEDGRKLAVSAMTAGLVGLILRSDLLYHRDALVLSVLSVVVWLLVYIEPAGLKEDE